MSCGTFLFLPYRPVRVSEAPCCLIQPKSYPIHERLYRAGNRHMGLHTRPSGSNLPLLDWFERYFKSRTWLITNDSIGPSSLKLACTIM
jgi:hypothetical protein